MREHDGEGARADVAPQQVDRAARDAEVGDHALLLERLQGLQRPAGRDALLEGDVLGVVEVDEPEPVEPQPLQALLDRPPDAVAGEVAGLHVAIDLRLEHEAVGDAAALLQHDADAALGVAVVVAGVEEVDRAVDGPLHGRHRVLLRHVAGVGEGRVAERRGADAQRRDPRGRCCPGRAGRVRCSRRNLQLDLRLGSPLPQTWDSPAGWVAAVQRHGFRAAYWPLGDDADADTVGAYADAAAAADIVIAEIGAWSNPLSPDAADARGRARALQAAARARRPRRRALLRQHRRLARGHAGTGPIPTTSAARRSR